MRLLHGVQEVLALLHLAILVIQEETMNTVIPRYLFPHWFTRRVTCEFLSQFWQFRQRVSPCWSVVLISIWVFGFCWSMRQVPCTSTLILSLLAVAGCSVGVTVSCDEDVGEVGEDEVKEPVDRPWTTNGTLFSV